MKSYFYGFNDNTGLLINLLKDSLESLLSEAEQLEKQYEWLQAAKLYGKAVILVNNSVGGVEVLEKMGFNYYKAAMKAPTNEEFKNRMQLAIQTYKKGSELLKKKSEEHTQAKLNHFLALIAYASSCLEKDPEKKKKLLAEWWSLEKKAKEQYEKIGDLYSLAKTCNNLVEYSSYDWLWSSTTFKETKQIYEECINLTEKSIPILLELKEDYELARAYCFSGWYFSFSNWYWESKEKIKNLFQKAKRYSDKALQLAHKIGDAWLLSQSYIASHGVSQRVTGNVALSIDLSKKILKYGELTQDNWCMGWGHVLRAFLTVGLAWELEDPDKQRLSLENAIKMIREANKLFQRINSAHELHETFNAQVFALSSLVEIESNQKTKIALLEQINRLIKDRKDFFKNREVLESFFSEQLSLNLLQLAKTEREIEKKHALLLESKSCIKQQISYSMEMQPFRYAFRSNHYFRSAMVLKELAVIEPNKSRKIDLLNEAADLMRKSIELSKKREKLFQGAPTGGFYYVRYYDNLGKILQQTYFLTKDKNQITEAIDAYKKTVFCMEKAGLPTYMAEAQWHLAQLYEQVPNLKEASEYYELASKAYAKAAQKILKLKDFYNDYSQYMEAWNQIEQAKYNHSIEEYEKAKIHYEKAAKLHKSSESWNYLAPNYFAWASMEEAEDLSRKECTQRAKETFQTASNQFTIAENSIKQKKGELDSTEEKELTHRLLQASDLRRRFCQSRILIEEAKLLDREGEYLQSSQNYGEAARNIQSIVEKVESEAERKELEYLATLCKAWGKMADAEETTSMKAYLEAAKLFEKAKEYCFTRRASLWALGNSNFCKGLAAGIKYQSSISLADHSRAKSLMKSAATSYLQAGFKHASEYVKATQRLFDAYLFMNQAESETDQQKRAKLYQMAENLLQVATGSFMKAKQPEKVTQIQNILGSVREEKALAVSLNEVMHAPTITSSTMSFTAPSPTNEASVGLEQFQHANVQANLIAGLREVRVGESFCLSVEFVNAGKEPALLTRVDDFVPRDFVVVKKPEIYRLEKSCLNMKGKHIAPLKLVEAKVVLQPSKRGVYQLNPKVHYLDENGQSKLLQLKSMEIKVEEVVLANRISTGTKELDTLLLGGIPEEYAVALTGPASDERELVITNFLQTSEDETSFYVSTEAAGLKNLLQKPNFYLFLCNPKPKVSVADSPNIYKLHGKADINNLNIALLRAYRTIDQASNKKICLNIVSDVLTNYTIRTARQWIAKLTTDLVSKGFTVLAVINPLVHTPEELNNLLELFDGEISLTQTEDQMERKKVLIVKKLRNQDYIKNSIFLTKQK